MKLAILHYHLNPGGVTQVIGQHLRALELVAERLGLEESIVLYDGQPSRAAEELAGGAAVQPRVRIMAVPGLGYDEETTSDPDSLANDLQSVLSEAGFESDRTLLHVHNHCLGKNASLPGALRKLAADGYRQLLQIHDFAEDLRPANYRHLADAWRVSTTTDASQQMYPRASHIHYAVLNHRDLGILRSAGAEPDRLHLLPNPVGAPGRVADPDAARRRFQRAFDCENIERIIVYPVRAIRRKNVGEFLLIAAFADRGMLAALTLPATSDAERPTYTRWREAAERWKLPVRMEVGLSDNLTFPEILAAADRILTTSIAEGFGMVFLEAWLCSRMLVGRNLPEITADFVEQGVDLSHLAARVEIPMAWVGADAVAKNLAASYRDLAGRYGRDPESIDRGALDRLASAETVDFARLTPQQQMEVIERVWTDRKSRDIVREGNPVLWDSLATDSQVFGPLIARNAAAVREHWSLEASAGRLEAVYRSVMTCPCSGTIGGLEHPERILEQFLSIDRLYPLRVAV